MAVVIRQCPQPDWRFDWSNFHLNSHIDQPRSIDHIEIN